MNNATTDDPRLLRVVTFFEGLRTPADLAALPTLYHPDVQFKDPFNTVSGTAAVRRIFEHMFATQATPRFEVLTAFSQGNDAFVSWDFHITLRGQSARIHGASHLRFANDDGGRVLLHRDYWDAAEELYEKLPLLGTLMRWLRRQLAA
jgi:steroid delta-isomerase